MSRKDWFAIARMLSLALVCAGGAAGSVNGRDITPAIAPLLIAGVWLILELRASYKKDGP